MDVLQIIYYFPYLNVYIPQFWILFLKCLAASLFSFKIPFYDDLQSNIQSNAYSIGIENFDTSNKKFQDNGIEVLI